MTERANAKRMFKALTQADDVFVQSGLAERDYRLPGKSTDRVRYAGLVTSQQWDKLGQHADRRIAQAHARLTALQTMQARILESASGLEASADIAEKVPRLTELAAWPPMRAKLLEEYGTSQVAHKRVEDRLSAIERLSATRELVNRERLLSTRAADLDRTARQLLTTELAARFAHLVVSVNNVAAISPAMDRMSATHSTATLEKAVGNLQNTVATGDWAAVASASAALGDTASSQAQALVTKAARGRSDIDRLTTAAAIRYAFEVVAEACWTAWTAGWCGRYGSASWPKAARTRKPTATRTKPAGTAIEGKVTSVTIEHRDRKAISTVVVVTDAGEETVVLPGIKFDSSGAVAGSYVRLICSSPQQLNWGNKVTGRQLLRYELASNAKTNWGDWLAYQSRDLFNAWPNGVVAEWTLQPGSDGAGNPLRYGVWTTERTLKEVPYGGV